MLTVTALCLAQSASVVEDTAVQRVGTELACLCGSCKNTVANCPMIHCHYASPAREKIMKMAGAGVADDEIVATFTDEHGLEALASPPKEGFSLLSWVMPFVAIGLGLMAIWWFVRRYMGNKTPVPSVDAEVLERYKDRIEKDLAKID